MRATHLRRRAVSCSLLICLGMAGPAAYGRQSPAAPSKVLPAAASGIVIPPLPWLAGHGYFRPTATLRPYWFDPGWTVMSESRDGREVSRVTRAGGPGGRLESIVSQQGPTTRTVRLGYDDAGRVATVDDDDGTNHFRNAYRFAPGTALDVASEENLVRSGETLAATHTRGADGRRTATVTDASGRRVEERVTGPGGQLERLSKFLPDGRLAFEEVVTPGPNAEVAKSVRTTYEISPSGEHRAKERTTEESTFGADGMRTRQVVTNERISEAGTMAVIGRQESDYEGANRLTREHTETLVLGADGSTRPGVETTTTNRYDDRGRLVESVESGTNHETGQARTNRSTVAYSADGRTETTSVDSGGDGTIDQEDVRVTDAAGRVVESRSGPPGGPFASLERNEYDREGRLRRSETFRDGGTAPSRVLAFTYPEA